MADECEINLQWKGTDTCYDFYCPCGGTSTQPDPAGDGDERTVTEGHGHQDGYFRQEFQCGACGRWWHLPNKLFARPGKFIQEGEPPAYGCGDCATGHRGG